MSVLSGILSGSPPAAGWDMLRRLHDAFALSARVWLTAPGVPTKLLPPDWPMGRLSEAVLAIGADSRTAIDNVLEPFLAEHPYAALLERYPVRTLAGGAPRT